jgi:hypothetical protein
MLRRAGGRRTHDRPIKSRVIARCSHDAKEAGPACWRFQGREPSADVEDSEVWYNRQRCHWILTSTTLVDTSTYPGVR